MGKKDARVDAYIAKSPDFAKPILTYLREVIHEGCPDVVETIKWSTPTFTYKGNLVSVQPRAKQFVSLLFHTGASIPGDHPLLEGGGDTARYARLDDLDAVERATPQLEAVVRAWCDACDADPKAR